MELSKSPEKSKLPEANQDRISNLPSIVIDKILKCLPIPMVARMSVLSTEWRAIWLSHRYLVFDEAFWKGQGDNASRVNSIISNILLLHNGPLHEFQLRIPQLKGKQINLNQYLSFLSRTCVKEVVLENSDERVANLPIPSHLFACKELVELALKSFTLNPPRGFKGFAYLCILQLFNIKIKHDILGSLITNCRQLKVLVLLNCIGIANLVIDAPKLECLLIRGGFDSLNFRSVARLRSHLLYLEPTADNKVLHNDMFNYIKLLATSSELQFLDFGGHTCQLLAAGGVINSLSLSFNHLKRLQLTKVNWGDLNVFRFSLGMIQSCPCVEHLEISVIENRNAAQHNIEFNDSYKLNHLTTMKITGITGSTAELKFLTYVLSMSFVLESLYFEYGNLDPNSKLKVSYDLLRLRRASAKAQLVCLDQ